MIKGNLVNFDGEFCTQKQENGEELTVSLHDNEESKKYAEERWGFTDTVDSDGGTHFGIWVSEEELNHRIEMIRRFYTEGMIPWLCPSCGKVCGGMYDVGSMVWFKCHCCGAEWEQKNPHEMDEIIADAKKPKLKLVVLE